MRPENNNMPALWEDLRHQLEDSLAIIQQNESNRLRMAAQSIPVALDFLGQIQDTVVQYSFRDGEEVLYYKHIKPFFISTGLFYSRLFKIETGRPAANGVGLQAYYTNELTKIASLYEDHRFINHYLQTGSTYLDEKLFFRPGLGSVFALSAGEAPPDGAFPICYDHVVGHLLAADLLTKYLLEAIADLSLPEHVAGNLPKITFTGPKAHLVEMAYAFYASGLFNNGKAPLKDIIECLEAAFHAKTGNYSRIMQEILYRKSGYTVCQDAMKNAYLLYIQRIEDKHIG